MTYEYECGRGHVTEREFDWRAFPNSVKCGQCGRRATKRVSRFSFNEQRQHDDRYVDPIEVKADMRQKRSIERVFAKARNGDREAQEQVETYKPGKITYARPNV